MSNKFEKLIEYVINEEDSKASELFHEIVVEKSRNIYENLMSEDEVAEDTVTEMGGDEVDDFIDDVEADEEGIDVSDEDDDAVMDFDNDSEADDHEEEHEELEDRVVDLEDKLDELMAEFDDMMGDDAEAPVEELPAEEEEVEMEMESVDETEEVVREYTEKAPKPVTSDNSDSTTSPVAGKNDMGGKAVDPTGEEKGRTAPKAKDMGAKGPQDAGKLEAAPKPKKGE